MFKQIFFKYGQIHVVIKELVLDKYGQDVWIQVLTRAKLDGEGDFLQFKNYPDESFCRMIVAITDCVSESMDDVLEEFGDFFVKYCLSYGYDKMLRTLGSDVVSFSQNLDSLHSLLSLTYTGMIPPSFRCEKIADGSLQLHYYSCRSGLAPLVIGLMRAVGREIFNQSVELRKINTAREDFGRNRTQEHTVFAIDFSSSSPYAHPISRQSSRENGDFRANHTRSLARLSASSTDLRNGNVTLSGRRFCETFPYHVFFNKDLTILQCGDAFQKLLPAGVGPGSSITQAFCIQYPRMEWSLQNLLSFTNTIFLLAVLPSGDRGRLGISFRGQMLWLEEEQQMMFIGSPRLKSLKEMKDIDLHMSDIPLFDVTREIVLLYEQRNAEIGITQKLDQTTAELKRISQELEDERQKTERLLHQMLPPKVAMQLKNGQVVEAETFQAATILFSDVVTFTNIASACPPEKIVDMLNDMYERFDNATTRWEVYKVETIGDAYMVVGGVPERSPDHAQRVARFSIDMVAQAALVPSPATGLPLQIRVGVHTGPVMAGVVGVKMPRYCLFGDTVNTASRMESHGVPGRIQLSPDTLRCLQDSSFRIKRRGAVQVKGKGLMTTFFLLGDCDVTVVEPDDEFTSLPLIDSLTALPVSPPDETVSVSEMTAHSSAGVNSTEGRNCQTRIVSSEDKQAADFDTGLYSKLDFCPDGQPLTPRRVKPDYSFLVSGRVHTESPRVSTKPTGVHSKLCAVL